MTFDIHLSFIHFSYGAGLVGSLVYMRMLGNTIDSMADGAKGLVKYVNNEFVCIFCSFCCMAFFLTVAATVCALINFNFKVGLIAEFSDE